MRLSCNSSLNVASRGKRNQNKFDIRSVTEELKFNELYETMGIDHLLHSLSTLLIKVPPDISLILLRIEWTEMRFLYFFESFSLLAHFSSGRYRMTVLVKFKVNKSFKNSLHSIDPSHSIPDWVALLPCLRV